MASSLYNLALDFSKELNYTKAIMARQGDKGITVTVKPYLNGLQMDTSGGTFTLKGTTPSNRYVDSVATSVTSEEVTFSLDGTFMSEAGYYKHCYVEYRKDNQILTTQDIIFFSLGVSDISQGQADEYVSQLEELIRKYNETFDAFMAETKGRVDSLNQQITDLTGQAKTLQDKLDALKEEISKLGNLQVMYSNSIDFGDYDYSGNPNLSAKLNASSFSSGTGATVADDGDEIVFTLDGTNQLSKYATRAQTAVIEGKQYTISCEIMLETGFTGDPSGIRLQHAYLPGGIVVLQTATVPKNELNKWQKLIGTQTVKYTSDTPNEWYPLVRDIRNLKPSGKVRLKNIKIEEGDQATPYQPNLLDAPYYLSKVALGENIANKTIKYPIKTSAYAVYTGPNTEPYIAGQKYTLTMKATKPATQTFNVFLDAGTIGVGSMTPVDGLTDVWQKTFTVSQSNIDAGVKDRLTIYQVPNSSVGAVQIDWLKIEKGDTRTPNISQFKYFGEGLKDSNNPNDYSWDITPEYAEKALTNTLNLTDPQTALGLKNFKDGAQIDGVDVATVKNLGSVLQSGSGLTTIQSDKQSAFDEFSYEFERIGDRVFFHARVKTNSTTAVASHVNLLEIPLGFQFPVEWTIIGIPLSVVQWTTPQGEISALVITDLTGKQVVKFATNRVGNHYISGEWRTADSYPETK
ncbi:BppU family phage baseplate upper protein [Enterococcus faecium]|uniref:BppU family phage baseplate upper protein n=1 Tax=Enterococcus faecium TaxID=1352 RepID=UPI00124BD538|nr:BppU family phage baseplate upper protein [Enterococcus faecium]GER95791.1 hypothetical protein EfmAA708_08260 [Enterococcus faecium]